MSEQQPERPDNPRDFLDDLEKPINDLVEKGDKHDRFETRDRNN